MKTYFKITIDETAKNNLKDESHRFNQETIICNDLKDVSTKLIKRYGRLPKMKNKVYCNTIKGESTVIGFTYSFWNKDWSHNSKSWYQTDWVVITECKEQPILIKSINLSFSC